MPPFLSFLTHPSATPNSPSLRTRLVTASTIACLAAFILSGVIHYFSMRDSLYRQFDEALVARATALSALVEQEGETLHLQSDPSVTSTYSANQRRNFFEILGPDGSTLLRSPSLGDDHLPPSIITDDPDAGSPARADIRLPDGREARMVALPFVSRPDEERPPPPNGFRLSATILVASDVKHVSDNLFRFTKQLLLVSTGATFATAVALWWLISFQLRPVNHIAEQISRVGRDDLNERLDPGPAPAELFPVVGRLNELLARLSATLDREKAFTADVAHELRTPISALETALEVSGSRLREPETYRQTVNKCLRTVREMHSLVDRLLTLARADAEQLTVKPIAVSIKPFLEEIWDALAEPAARRNLSINWDIPPSATITTDPELLRLLAQNALDNAITYTPANTVITVRWDGQSLHFMNTAPAEMTPEQTTHVFDRFWRADHARQSGHVGIGLPLCQKLMQSLGGQATATLDPPSLFHLTLSFG